MKLKWTDPNDLTGSKPVACTWAGTVVVRKENEPPKHKWDGTVIVNETTKNTYQSTWLEDNTIELNKVYYYGIFPYHTIDSVSYYRFTKVIALNTSVNVTAPEITDIEMGGGSSWDGSELAIMWSGNNNKLTVQIASSHIVFKLYTGNTEIYSFTSPVGSSASDAKKIHVAFLKDDDNEVAKPSFVYHTGSGTYSYNQESPSDAEMGLIYTWLQGGA